MSEIIFTENEYDKLLMYVKTILELNKNSEEYSYEILISSVGYANKLCVEINQYNHTYDEQDHFKLVGSDWELMKEYHLPDNHYEFFRSDEEYNEYLADWLAQEKEEGREWIKGQYHNSWCLKDSQLEE